MNATIFTILLLPYKNLSIPIPFGPLTGDLAPKFCAERLLIVHVNALDALERPYRSKQGGLLLLPLSIVLLQHSLLYHPLSLLGLEFRLLFLPLSAFGLPLLDFIGQLAVPTLKPVVPLVSLLKLLLQLPNRLNGGCFGI